MTRKIARQSEVTPLNTIDEYLWNERLGVSQLPETGIPQVQDPNLSSLPPQPNQAPALEYDSSQSQSDMFGTGVSGAGQLISPKTPNTTPASVPARSKAASKDSAFGLAEHLMDEHGFGNEDIRDHEENVKSHNDLHSYEGAQFGDSIGLGHRHSAVSTLYGDVSPTPTTGESSNNGAQANRNNSSESLPNGPDSGSPTTPAATAEEGGAGLAADLGEAATLALVASKYRIGSTLDPVDNNLKFAKYHYIRKEGDEWCIWQKNTGKTLSCHSSKEKAEASFRALEMGKHGG